MFQIESLPVTAQQVQVNTQADPILNKVAWFIKEGWPKKCLMIYVIAVIRVGVIYLICINQGPRPRLIQIKCNIFLHLLQQICIHIEWA